MLVPGVCGCAHVGGNFNNGANDGLFYWNLNNGSSNSNINIGARLVVYIDYLRKRRSVYYPYLLVKIVETGTVSKKLKGV